MSSHRVWRVGADVDTDQLAPGEFMQLGIDAIACHCLQTLRPEFAASVQRGDVLVAGRNFGIGSSREQAAAVLLHLGVAAVIAPSFGGLYFRNAFNLGLLLLTCPRAEELNDGELIVCDARASRIVSAAGGTLECRAIPDFLLDLIDAGGLFNLLKRRYPKEPADA